MKIKKLTLFVFVLILPACFSRGSVTYYSSTCDDYYPFIIIGSRKDTKKTLKKIDEWNSFIIELCPKKYEDVHFKNYP